ncbi:hypothetical protein NP233_g10151 [Leucocoprinus birnbaumii]|uniref:Uncharacterized protein n=1 Tax=Leucocoprinus birnbaumii TaxID=56174 RepID=A0AAD5YMF3_9AGAR|nr:hypothetical protein NP233_g10151 [Leucocoprinus birnbaumii]
MSRSRNKSSSQQHGHPDAAILDPDLASKHAQDLLVSKIHNWSATMVDTHSRGIPLPRRPHSNTSNSTPPRNSQYDSDWDSEVPGMNQKSILSHKGTRPSMAANSSGMSVEIDIDEATNINNNGFRKIQGGAELYPQLGGSQDIPGFDPGHLVTPRLTTIPLPSVTTYHSQSQISANETTSIQGERGRTNTTFHELELMIDVELRRSHERRPIVQPFSSDLPPYEGHLWGAVNDYRQAAGGRAIHFLDSRAPATQPPTRTMEVITGSNRSIRIFPGTGDEFVTVGDVQRVVIAWMRSIDRLERLYGQNADLSEMWPIHRGLDNDIEVWMWRGLEYERPGV